jgi:putative hydrolase of the HAD superfamily
MYNLPMIKTICFDLDGVYFLNGKTNFIKALGELGIGEDEAKRVFLKSDEMNNQYKIGKMTDEEFWSWALKEWNLKMATQDVMDLLIKGYETNPFVVEYVKKVKKAGYKTAICSSNFPARINGLHNRFGFLDDFDVIALSYEVGVNKPDKQLYEALITKSGVEPSEIVYSDDYEPAINTAKALGISTFLYTDFDAFIARLEGLGVKL